MNIVDYFFNKIPGQEFGYYVPMAVLIILMFGAAIAFSGIYKTKRKHDFAFKRLFRKTAGRLSLFALLFLVLTLLRYENIPYFAMRIWLYLAALWFLYFLYRNIHTYKKVYPREKENAKPKHVTVKEENKYLPAKKRK